MLKKFLAVFTICFLRQPKSREQKDFFVKEGQLYFNGLPYPQRSYFDTGIPAYTLDELMLNGEVDELVKRVFQGLPMSSEEFDELLLPVIRNFSALVHCLPASESHHHRAPLGLLCHSLRVAVYTMNVARSKYFQTGRTPREVRDNEDRWHVAAVLAGLLHDAGKPLTDYQVIDNSGKRWRCVEPLAVWLEKNESRMYKLDWNRESSRAHEEATGDAASLVLTPEIRDYLTLHTREIWQDLYNLLEGRVESSRLNPMMMQAKALSIKKDLELTSGKLSSAEPTGFDAEQPQGTAQTASDKQVKGVVPTSAKSDQDEEGSDESAELPHDFDQMMSQLTEQEEQIQPALEERVLQGTDFSLMPPKSASIQAKPKHRKKKRKLSIREEHERDSRNIQREQRREKRLNSPTELTPQAIRHKVERVQANPEPSKSTGDIFSPPKDLGQISELTENIT